MVSSKRRKAQKLRHYLDLAIREGHDKVEQFTHETAEMFREDAKNLSREWSIRELFESLVDDGGEYLSLSRQTDGGFHHLREGADIVDTSKFANINGQIVYSAMMDAYDDVTYIGERLVTNIPTEFNGEKIPGIGRVGDDSGAVNEGEEYPRAVVGEEWIETPEIIKRGLILDLTLEEVFHDRTGLITKRASDVGRSIRISKEKRILDVVLGISTVYRRNGSSAVATYQDGDWDNLQASNALVDWTDIENAELLFDGMTDPNTGEPISIGGLTLIVPTALKHTAKRITSATEIRNTAGANNETISASPLDNYMIESNSYVKARTSSATTWFVGEPKKAFAYMENWPLRLQTQDDTSHESFNRDVVARYKASEKGTPAVMEPRYMVKCTA